MARLNLKQAWASLRNDPPLLILLCSSAFYFVVYYASDPARQPGILPDWLMTGPRSLHLGWFGYYDQSQYLRMAHTLASLNFHQLHSTYSYGLGYPLTAVPGIWLGFNNDPFIFFNFFAFIFAIYAVYVVAKQLISPFAGFLAGFGLLFATPLIHYVDTPWNSTVCLVVMSTILLTLTVKKITKWHALLLGLLVGWAFAARYVDVLFLGTLAVAAIYRGSLKSLYKQVVFMAIGVVVVALPVLYSQYVVFGSPFRTPYVNHIGLGGVGGSDQGLQAYSLKRVPQSALALFVSPLLAGSADTDRGLLIDFFWAIAAIPGVFILMRNKSQRVFFGSLVGVGFVASVFYLSFRASTPGSLKYGELHYFKMFWPVVVLMAVAFFNELFTKPIQYRPDKDKIKVIS